MSQACHTTRFLQVLKTRLARSSGSPPYAQKLLQGWVLRSTGGFFSAEFCAIRKPAMNPRRNPKPYYALSLCKKSMNSPAWDLHGGGTLWIAGASVLSDDLIIEDVCNDSVEIQCLTEKCQVKSRSRCQGWTRAFKTAKKMDIVHITFCQCEIKRFSLLGMFLICLFRKVHFGSQKCCIWG